MSINLSFIVPVFNGEHSIHQCIDSILSQTLKEGTYEIIVVDNNSTDRTCELLKVLPIKLYSATTQGPSAARNLGISKAQGKFLAFVDADVRLAPNWAEELLRHLTSPVFDCVASPIFPVGDGATSKMTSFRQQYIRCKTYGTFNYFIHSLDGFPVLNTAAFMMKRSALRGETVRFDETLKRCEDMDFTYQLLFRGAHLSYVTATHADVTDNRTPLSYLKRSFLTGFYHAKVIRKWGKIGSVIGSHFFKDQSSHYWMMALNQLSSALGSAVGSVFLATPENIKNACRPDPRNAFLLFKKTGATFALGPWIRLVALENQVVLINILSAERLVMRADEAMDFLRFSELQLDPRPLLNKGYLVVE